ncbi:MAG: hypothetical protein SFY67_04370 [Candidatus Melainabacteria bacterium]|nr:hypothetical protein [Candidatus Melainabacteria bacterium]
MRTVTVREVAQALNLTKRAIMYRLESGKLKGIRVKNDFGIEEWRIYPTKEIVEALNRMASKNPTEEPETYIDHSSIEAQEIGIEEYEEVAESSFSGVRNDRERIRLLAEELVTPLLEKIDSQTRLLIRQEIEIEDLKIKLLPDLEKKAEEERKAAELKELEIVALQKQIEALKETADNSSTGTIEDLENKISSLEQNVLPELQKQLETERKTKIAEVAKLQNEVEKLAQQAVESELIREKATELENQVPQLLEKLDKQSEEKAALEEEIERLRRENENNSASLKSELLKKNEKSWWKGFFGLTN